MLFDRLSICEALRRSLIANLKALRGPKSRDSKPPRNIWLLSLGRDAVRATELRLTLMRVRMRENLHRPNKSGALVDKPIIVATLFSG
jgi:hypothetical protein